ncbi:helix-turn-helix domain-containing protein [Kurthia huakuii]|uniref:helix-turn-helix domain-containing protein n=1 Tax=Kurthia huakuii TaxID=1421019 RepID=UPI000497A680|nr:helix-turn-helix transcriptional regulator [Kurthia huakuii]MBM7700859.1 hypothetical protein [Kurthia huakuii]
MDYSAMLDNVYLTKDLQPLAICEAVQPLYIDEFEHVAEWTTDVMMMQQQSDYTPSKSFQKLLNFVQLIMLDNRAFRKIDLREKLADDVQRHLLDQVMRPVLQEAIRPTPDNKKNTAPIKKVTPPKKEESARTKRPLDDFIIVEHKSEEQMSLEIPDINTEQIVSTIKDQEYLITNASHSYQALRDLVTKKDFEENEDGGLQKEIVVDGVKQGTAEIRTDEEIQRLPADTLEKQRIWFSLLESTNSALDELSADLFDLIAFSWMKQPKNDYGYIHFDSDQALRLKFEDPYEKSFRVREKERFDIMQRVATLASVWIAMDNDDFIVINPETEDIDRENYEFADFHPLFQIGSIEMAYDKKTKKAKGIYSVTIKPSPLIDRLLIHNDQAFAYLDYKVFQYNYYKHRQHKRLVRFLNSEWKNQRNSEATTFRVGHLIEIMDFGKNSVHGARLRERVERVLDDLLNDAVIKAWKYTEPFEEIETAKRLWYLHVWENLEISITPPDQLVVENKRIAELKLATKVIDVPHEPIIEEEQELPLMDQVAFIIEERGITIKVAAEEANISYSTLHRYLKNPPKKISTKNRKPLEVYCEKWYSLVQMNQNS